jgi:hypothetical protein
MRREPRRGFADSALSSSPRPSGSGERVGNRIGRGFWKTAETVETALGYSRSGPPAPGRPILNSELSAIAHATPRET